MREPGEHGGSDCLLDGTAADSYSELAPFVIELASLKEPGG